MTIKEQIAVMQAFADGKEVEELDLRLNGCKWVPTKVPSWNWDHYNYRVKVAEFYVVEWEVADSRKAFTHKQRASAEKHAEILRGRGQVSNIRTRHVREIVE